ncbi:uncharacterized protein LOC115877655 [Sitophilus oryzae]|uniref:Uncharacterized protein LOC115877655 n=1 Tax=Sitophilus oryzae TaxID=7048 RepID=A0A6J2XF77_SITOR|nr:uncharacterized protein LOC115877655 [Sitophilus oryzae]
MNMFKKIVSCFCLFLIVIQLAYCQKGLSSSVYVEKQLLCALDKGPCDGLGRQIRSALPEIIGKNCQTCDNKQLANAKRIARFVQTKYPDVWNALVAKYAQPKN